MSPQRTDNHANATCAAIVFMSLATGGCADVGAPGHKILPDDGGSSISTTETMVQSVEMIEKTVDLGVVRSQVSAEVDLGLLSESEIESISKSCGCTDLGMREGQVISPGEKVRISIDMRSKPPGRGAQTALITFTSGVQYAFRFEYSYRPYPFSKPEYAVFKGSDSTASIDFFFSADGQVTLSKAELPDGIELVPRDSSSAATPIIQNMRAVRVILCAHSPHETRGTLTFKFESGERESFEIPYLCIAGDN